MKAVKIEKGIPIPKQRRGRRSTFPFDEMQPGDSFFVPVKDAKDKARVMSKVGMYGRKTGAKLSTRTVTGGLRIWLMARAPEDQPTEARAA
jgi:hypothetical protein